MRVIEKILKGFFQIYIAFLSVIPTEIGIFLRYWGYRPFFKVAKGKFRIDSGVTISGFKNIELGRDIQIQKNSYIYAMGANLKLGDRFFLGVNSQVYAVRESITIGNYCMIAPNCVLVSDNHRFDNIDTLIMEQGYDLGKIILEDNVWIGSNVVILKGIIVKHGAVVGAGSIVNRDVESNSVVGGVPIRLIKKRDD